MTRQSKCDFDSYTGAPIPAPKRSSIAGLWTPREAYYKTAAEKECAAQYGVHPRGDGQWIVLRAGCPESFVPRFATQGEAFAVMQWCVRQDERVKECIAWLKIGNGMPYIELMGDVLEVANQESWLASITYGEPSEQGYLPSLS